MRQIESATEPEPPTADTVEAALWRLTSIYALAALVLETTGARVGELEAARVGDLDESREAWLVRAAVSKTRRPRWVGMPADVFAAVIERLPAREDRDPTAPLFGDVTADRLRMAILRACRDAGLPLSARTRCVTVASACCTGRACRGPTSAIASASDRSWSPRIATRTRWSTTARSTGRQCWRTYGVTTSCSPSGAPR